jgi:hypothetical protein
MNEDRLEAVKRESGFESWRDRNTLGEGLFVWRYTLRGNEIPGGTIYLDQHVEMPAPPIPEAALAAAAPEEGAPPTVASPVLRLTQSLWLLSDRPEGPALRLDLYECASRAAAHEMLLHLLAEIQTTPPHRREDLEIGDVAFAAAGETALLFARANLAVVVSNAGRALVSMSQMARIFDVDLARKPEPSTPETVTMTAGVEDAEPVAPRRRARVGEAMPIDLAELEPAPGTETISAAAEAGPPPTLKLFYQQGDIAWAGDRLIYRPTAPGRQEIEVYTLGSTGAVRRRSLQVEAE